VKFGERWTNFLGLNASPERSFLAELERRALQWLLPRVPAQLAPADFTRLNMLGATMAATALLCSRWAPWALVFLPIGLGLNWLGAAVDAPLRALRQKSAPERSLKEHLADLFSQVLVILAYGFSPFLSVWSSAVILTCFLLFSAYTYIRVAAGREERMALIGIGAGEFRILMAFWPFLWLGFGLAQPISSSFSALDVAIAILAAVAILNLGLKVLSDGRRLLSTRG